MKKTAWSLVQGKVAFSMKSGLAMRRTAAIRADRPPPKRLARSATGRYARLQKTVVTTWKAA
jgi:hypothetical protein